MQATLVTDGSSDTVLLPILRWLFGQVTPSPIELRWADLRGLRHPPTDLKDRLLRAVEFYPCDVLLVHRDAEKQEPDVRYEEIRGANRTGIRHVCVVPVRMQEAWLLLDEPALREAAGRPSGKEPLELYGPKEWETLPDPKAVLRRALTSASAATGRRAKKFSPSTAAHRLADLVVDWSPLRQLPSFRRLEDDVRTALIAELRLAPHR